MGLGTFGVSSTTPTVITRTALGLAVAGTNPTLIGPVASANATRYPNALTVVSATASGIQQNESHNIGLIAEGTANSGNTAIYGIGLYGVGYTASATRCSGVVGEAHVSATGDTGLAIGVRGYANDTHAGGLNIGLYGDAAGGTSSYALYMNNGDMYTANVAAYQTWTFQSLGLRLTGGPVGIGAAPVVGQSLAIAGTYTGGTGNINYVAYANGTFGTDSTSGANGFATYLNTTAGATYTQLRHFFAQQNIIAGTVTSQYGFIAAPTLISAAANYGFFGNIAAGTGRYNFYAAGTAPNYFSGDVYGAPGSTTMTSGFIYIASGAGAPTGVPTGYTGQVPMYYDSTNNALYIYNTAWKKVLLV